MKTLQQLCTPRPSVFDGSKHDVVLDLTDLMDNRIHADEFFAENYVTEGMRRLLTHAFRRFRGETDVPMHLTHQEHSLAQ
jgi:predicted AAA+ superfamily ATPase